MISLKRVLLLTEFSIVFLILFFLPGQNFYQTFFLKLQKPLTRPLITSIPEPKAYPLKTTNIPAPELTAGSALVLDPDSSVILYAKNTNERFAPASTTKIMTALVALDEYDLNDILAVKSVETEGSVMGLKFGERLTVENLLFGLLVKSGNDAARVLAENYPGGRENFIAAMNKKAKLLNMNNTHFENEVGLEQVNHYTSSIDLARLSIYALKNSIFSRIVDTREITVLDTEKINPHYLENVNSLLGKIPGLYGIKTGWTENAGQCLVAVVERGGHKIITVILKSEDRFGETKNLIDWSFMNHRWVTPSTPS